MPYSRRNLKKKGRKVSLKQNNRLKFRKGTFGSKQIKQVWDNNKTTRQNYERLGLIADVNHIDKQAPSDHPLVQFVPQEVITKPSLHMSVIDQQHIQQLIQRYGDDYEAMFRDIKLNVDQWTVGQLKRKCELYKKLQEEMQEEMQEVEDEASQQEEDISLLEYVVYYKQNDKEASHGIS